MFGNILTNVSVGLHKDEVKLRKLLGELYEFKRPIAALEVMCRERAVLAKREMEYWLAEAEEWKQLRKSPDPPVEGGVTAIEGYTGFNYQ